MKGVLKKVEFNENYWDCECVENFIKPKITRFCASCQTHQEEQPDSIKEEVEALVGKSS